MKQDDATVPDDNNNSNKSNKDYRFIWREQRVQQRERNRARNRLRSIEHDVHTFLQPLWKELHPKTIIKAKDGVAQSTRKSRGSIIQKKWPLLANARAGCWYTCPLLSSSSASSTSSCYFKSADGHAGVWNMSLKRLNLPMLKLLAATGGCFVVDASRTKVLPDSFSRTLPLWAACMNRVIGRYRTTTTATAATATATATATAASLVKGYNDDCDNTAALFWDEALYTPNNVISTKEHESMEALLEQHVESVLQSGVILHPDELVRLVQKPLRPVWLTPSDCQSQGNLENLIAEWKDLAKCYSVIVCISCSCCSSLSTCSISQAPPSTRTCHENHHNSNHHFADTTDLKDFLYSPGAADDEESWARQLTPTLFWKHRKALLWNINDEDDDDDDGNATITHSTCRPKTNDETDAMIDQLVQDYHQRDEHDGNNSKDSGNTGSANELGNTGISIGTRRAGRPPGCWEIYDAILNVTTTEYPEMTQQSSSIPKGKYYFQLPVQEGKRDKTALEEWLAVGIVFILWHGAANDRRVLVHCAQGMDRSVAVVLAFLVLFCEIRNEQLSWKPCKDGVVSILRGHELRESSHKDGCANNENENRNGLYGWSGLSSVLVECLRGRDGRDTLLHWVRQRLKNEKADNEVPIDETPLIVANKETLRVALYAIQRHRACALPSRSTMQKLNRFFMSAGYEAISPGKQ